MISLVFTRSRRFSIFSWMVRYLTDSDISHVGISTQVLGIDIIVHSTIGGVQVETRRNFEQNNIVVFEKELRIPDGEDALKFTLNKHLGNPYDYLALPGLAFLLLLKKWFKILVKNPYMAPNALICSEFVLSLRGESRIPEWKILAEENTTPQDPLIHCGDSFITIL